MTELEKVQSYVENPDKFINSETVQAFLTLAKTEPAQLEVAISKLTPEQARQCLWQLGCALWKTGVSAEPLYGPMAAKTEMDPGVIWQWEFSSQLWALQGFEVRALERIIQLLLLNVPNDRVWNINAKEAVMLHDFFDQVGLLGFDEETPKATVKAMMRAMARFATVIKIIRLPTKKFESVLGVVIAMADKVNDQDALKICVELAPKTPRHKRLAFNLACITARQGNVPEMLRLVRIARKLGKEVYSFEGDADFTAYFNTPEFQEALSISPADKDQ